MRTIKTLYAQARKRDYLVGFGSPFGDYVKVRRNIYGEKYTPSEFQLLVEKDYEKTEKEEKRKSIKKCFGNLTDHSKITYNKKLIKSGDFLEYFEFEKDISKGALNNKTGAENKRGEFEKKVSVEEQRAASRRRTLRKFKRLVNANAGVFTKFITLAFDPKVFKNADKVEDSNAYFSNFIKRLKRLCEDRFGKKFQLKYVCGIEFQKNGAVHYHMMSNLHYLEDRVSNLTEDEKGYIWSRYGVDNKGFLTACWGAGYVDIQKIKMSDIYNCGAYIGKYISKMFETSDLFGKKLYFASRNLEKPVEYIGEEAEQIYLDNIKYITGVTEINTPYINFRKVTLKIGKVVRKVKEKVLIDNFVNLSDFIYEYDSDKFVSNIDGGKYEFRELLEKGFISEHDFYEYAGLFYDFKKNQLSFDFKEDEEVQYLD